MKPYRMFRLGAAREKGTPTKRLATALALAAVLAGCGNSGSGLPPGMSLSSFTAQTRRLTESRLHVSDIRSSSCIAPKTWKPGQHFTCYYYRSGGTEIGRVVGTVLPSHGKKWAANLSWHSAGS